MDDAVCTTHGWSPVPSATPHADLAGILAGFAFTAAIIVLRRQGHAGNRNPVEGEAAAHTAKLSSLQYVQTIAMFSASFILLGLDSYLFGQVAGSQRLPSAGMDPAGDSPLEACGRLWSQALMAHGMLALGAITMTSNVTTLFLSEESGIRDQRSRDYLRNFLLFLTGAAMFAVIMFLNATSQDFLDSVYAGRVPSWFYVTGWIVTVASLGLVALLGGRSCRKYLSPAYSRGSGGEVKNRLRIPIVLTVCFAIGAPATAALASRLPHWPAQATCIVVAVWTVGVVFPMVVIVWLAHAIPPAQIGQTVSAPSK